MRAGTPLFLLVAGAMVFSGCTTEEPPVAGDDDPLLIEDPDDYSYLNETNTSRAHIHDYWGGQDQRIILAEVDDTHLTVQGGFPTDPIRPLDGETFPQGTGKVELTVTWEDDAPGRYHDVGLYVKTAGDHRPKFLAEVENGDTVSMPVNNTQNDLPHQVISNWYFVLWFDADLPDAIAHFDGTIRVEAIAYRTLEIPAFPGHPDHWDGETSLPILDHEEGLTVAWHRSSGNRACVRGCFDTHRPDNGTIVPPETDHVEVVLTRDAAADLPLYLGIHGSGTTRFTVVDPDQTDGDTQRFVITMDEARPDGPYGKQSQWEFLVYTSDDAVYRPYVGTYALQVTAHREAV